MNIRDVMKHAKSVANCYSIGSLLVNGGVKVEFMEGRVEFTEYAGSCLSLAPSGKYYTPFAHSNVDPCPKCKGGGCNYCGHCGSREAHLDEVWYETFEYALGKLGLWHGGSDADGCDIMVGYTLDFNEGGDDPEDLVESLICQDPDLLEDRRDELIKEVSEAVEFHKRYLMK